MSLGRNDHGHTILTSETVSKESTGTGNGNINTSTDYFLDPGSLLVFIVGINSEYETNRATSGDERLYQFFLELQVPANQVVFIKDDKATLPTVRYHLSTLLQRHSKGATATSLLVYYGGHGLADHFCTLQGKWRHDDMFAMIEADFSGTNVLLLIDCCYSGNVEQVIPAKTTKRYIVFMATLANCNAGPAWTMTHSFMQHCREQSLQDIIRIMAHDIMTVKFECLRVALRHVDPRVVHVLPASSGKISDIATEHTASDHDEIPLWTIHDHSIKDGVYAQWTGGPPTSLDGSDYLPPLFFCAKVRAVMEQGAILVEFHHCQITWTAVVQHVLPSYAVHNWIQLPEFFAMAQADMATTLKWMDWSVKEGTELWHYSSDGRVTRVKVVHFSKINWKGMVRELRMKGDVCGSYIPVQINSTATTTAVLRQECVLCSDCGDDATLARAILDETIPPYLPTSPHEAMLFSMLSAGKTIVTAATGQSLIGWWTCDDTWYSAKPFDAPFHELTLQLVAGHVRYTEPGDYCIVRWDVDSSISIVPLASLRSKSELTTVVKLV